MEDLLLNVIHRVGILAVPPLDSAAFLMGIANVNVALIFGLQILEKVILLLNTNFTIIRFQNKPGPCITRKARTTDAQTENSLHCTAENSIPIPNF